MQGIGYAVTGGQAIPQFAQQDAKVSTVDQAHNGLTLALQELHGVLGSLEMRLAAVLQPTPVAPGDKSPGNMAAVPSRVSERITDAQRGVDVATGRVRMLLDRLEL